MYQFPESAVFALRALTVYSQWRNQPIDRPEKIIEVSQEILDIIPSVIKENRKNLSTDEIFRLLQGYGFKFPESIVTTSIVEAVNATKNISYPVVLKMATELVEHKTDEGGVKVDIRSEKELVEAWNKIQKSYDRLNIQKNDRQIMVQKYYHGGVEMALGASVDKQFGPIVMVGTGGILIELLEDVSFGRAPISRRTAQKMIRKLKGYPLLLGYRGDNPVDVNALEEAILRVSQLVSDNRQIVELDINPILIFEANQEPIVLDARIKIKKTY
jgi:acyl-CoA synthetase (NDP forming)